MSNSYLENLRDEYQTFVESDPTRAQAAEGQIRKIVGPLSDDEERHFFGRNESQLAAEPEPED